MSNKTSDKNVVEYKVELNRNKSIETLKEALNKIEIRGEQLYLLKQAIKHDLAEREQKDKRIKELESKLYELKLSMYSISGIQYDKIPSESHNKDIILSQITEIDDVNAEIMQLNIKKQALYNKHLGEIAKVPQEKYRTVLRCWYLLKLDISSIENTMKISRQHIYKIKREAEKEFMRQNATN